MKKRFLAVRLLLAALTMVFVSSPVSASCDPNTNDLNARIACLSSLIGQSENTKSTLSNQINFLNNQIELTQLQIDAKQSDLSQQQAQLDALTGNINDLSSQIASLQSQLDSYAKDSVHKFRVAEAVKNANPYGVLFNSGITNLTSITYQQYIQYKEKDFFNNVVQAKNNLDSQKLSLQDKQTQEQKVRDQMQADENALQSSQNQLALQRSNQQRLLSVTKNNESNYQTLLAQARAQLNSLAGGSGAYGVVYPHYAPTDGWGTYFNQHDSWWASDLVGYASSGDSCTTDNKAGTCTVSYIGCLVTSIAMVFSHYGDNVDPSIIANNGNYFEYPTALVLTSAAAPPNHSLQYINYGPSVQQIRDHLNIGPVILGMYVPGGTHWVVVRSWDANRGDFVINDPAWPQAQGVYLSTHYSVYNAFGARFYY